MPVSGRGAKQKGNRAEREVAALIQDHLGYDVRRTLAGHADDLGDISGLPETTIQVKNYADVARALREGLVELVIQQVRTGTPFAAAFVRRPGGRYVVAMTTDQWFAMWRAAVERNEG